LCDNPPAKKSDRAGVMPATRRAKKMRTPGMESITAQEEANLRFVAQRNYSLTSGGRYLFIGFLSAVVLAIAVGFALNGAWLILPFAGLEVLGLVLACRAIKRQAGDYESVSIVGDKVVIHQCRSGQLRMFEFNRYWAQAVLSPAPGRPGGKLAIRSHGREVEIGNYLTAAQRAAAARQLRERLNIR
jgi:uncharacterized membrane protein